MAGQFSADLSGDMARGPSGTIATPRPFLIAVTDFREIGAFWQPHFWADMH
jgi:hypothetical protein